MLNMKNRFGGAIYALRKSKGLTQAQLGEIINVSETAISKWERGVTLPDIVTLCNVADYFGISLEELLGREKSGLCMSDKYTEEQIRGFEAGLQLLKCCNAARQYGLLAMEETAIKGQMDEFLVFGVQFILSGMRKGLSVEQIFQLLQNYADTEVKCLHARMIVDALKYIVSGESEEYLKEVLASFLGRDMRGKLLQKELGFAVNRDEILNGYREKRASTELLEELLNCTEEQVRFLLKHLGGDVLVPALSGASGEVCVRFLSNLSDRMLSFMDEDIRKCEATSEQILEAQCKVLEKAVEWKIIVPENRS